MLLIKKYTFFTTVKFIRSCCKQPLFQHQALHTLIIQTARKKKKKYHDKSLRIASLEGFGSPF